MKTWRLFCGHGNPTGKIEDTRSSIEDIMERAEKKGYIHYLVVDESTGMFAGFLDLKNIDWSIPKSDVGCYW